MKTLIKNVVLLLVVTQLNSQERPIETESVTLDNLFTFVVDYFEEKGDSQNITFLIKTHKIGFSDEDKFILKQTFKLLSKRLTEDDYISIATYNNYSGIALQKSSATDLKKLLYTVEHPKKSIEAFAKDGIEFAYKYANINYVEDYDNTVIMVRLPERKDIAAVSMNNTNIVANTTSKKNKGTGAAVVLSALALLPEIIQVIKD